MQGPLPLILYTAFNHPSVDLKETIWSQLESWLNGLGAQFSEDEVEGIFEEVRGTDLEPFYLKDEHRRIANFLVRVAFTPSVDLQRFRIASQDTIGNAGGLVLLSNRKYFFSERFAFGKNRLERSNLKFYAPNTVPILPGKDRLIGQPHACMSASDNGLEISIDLHVLSGVGWAAEPMAGLPDRLIRHSFIGDDGKKLSEIGLTIRFDDGRLTISTGSPETLIRLSAYIVQESPIVLSGFGDYDLAFRLLKTGQGNAKISVIAQDGFAAAWMDVNGFGAPELGQEIINEISSWALPHATWIN